MVGAVVFLPDSFQFAEGCFVWLCTVRFASVLGRSRGSTIDMSTYCPKYVFTEPGPLHMNADEINSYMRERLEERFADKRDQLLCTTCGYPSCTCRKCRGKNAAHTCWLQARCAGKRSKRWIAEREDQLSERTEAWSNLGLTPPVFRDGAFVFE